MARTDEQKTWWVTTLLACVFLPTVLISCASAPASRIYVGPEARIKVSGSGEHTFPDVWKRRTIQFSGSRGRDPASFITPFSGGGPGGGGNLFPLQVAATLMDSTLIESGLRHFTDLAVLTPEEEAEFRRKYTDRYDPEHHLLIWCDIRTGMAANYLNLDRWTVYIEDNDMNRCEPVRVIQEHSIYNQTVMTKPLAFQSEFGFPAREIHLKRVMLCFPRFDYYGEPILSDRTKHLKLIFQLNEDGNMTGEGAWIFKQ